jgi:hypothetical protein
MYLLKPINPENPYPGVSTEGYGLWECRLYYHVMYAMDVEKETARIDW